MHSDKVLHILGVGHNTSVYIDLAEILGYSIAGLYHHQADRVGETVWGHRIVGTHDELLARADLSACQCMLSMGHNAIRRRLAHAIRERGGSTPTLVHPNASVSRYARVAQGVIVQANATVQADASIAEDSVVSFSAGVAHCAQVGRGVYLSAGAIVGAYTEIGDEAQIGIGAILISGKVPRIGAGAIIGAGAVVTREVHMGATVAGNPARIVRP